MAAIGGFPGQDNSHELKVYQSQQGQSTGTATADRLVRLPHTGLRVPDTSLSISRYRGMEMNCGFAFTANLRVGNKVVGSVENEGRGGDTWLRPRSPREYGETHLEAYAARCRTEEGAAVSAEWLLEELISEHEWTLKVRNAETKGRLLLRRLGHIMVDDHERSDSAPYPQGEADSLMPANQKQRDDLRDALLRRMPPGEHGWWQGWQRGAWRDVTPRPEGVRTDLYG